MRRLAARGLLGSVTESASEGASKEWNRASGT